jgi:hypothetical protein
MPSQAVTRDSRSLVRHAQHTRSDNERGIKRSCMRSLWHRRVQQQSVRERGCRELKLERSRIRDARDHTFGILALSRTVRCDVCRFKRVGGLELELRLVPDDGVVAGVRLYFDGAMPSVEAR